MRKLLSLSCLLLGAACVQGQFDFSDLPFMAQASKSSGFNPSSVKGMVFWYAASDYSGQTNNAPITNLLDKSASANHATNFVVANAPRLTNNAINGKSAIRFTSANSQWLSVSNSSPFGTARAGEVFAVLRSGIAPATDETHAGGLWQMGLAGCVSQHPNSSNYIVEGFGLGTSYGVSFAGWAPTFGQSCSNWHVYAVQTSTNDQRIRYNGELIGGNDVAASGFTNRIWLGTSYNAAQDYWDGYLAEIIAYSNILADADRQSIHDYLAAKYSIPCTNTTTTYAPSNFAGLFAQWDATSLAGVIPDGASLSNWPDSSGFGHPLTNQYTAQTPTWRSNIYNGKPTVSWDCLSTRKLMMYQGGPTNYTGTGLSFISVGRYTNGAGNAVIASTNDGNMYLNMRNTGANYDTLKTAYSGNNSVLFSRGWSNFCANMFVQQTNGGKLVFYVGLTNTSSYAGGSTNLVPLGFQQIGMDKFGSFHMGGDLCELLYYTNQMSGADYAKLYYFYFKPKWAVP